MSILKALLAEATDEDLDQLAELLRPRLKVEQPSSADRWLRGADAIAAYIGAPRSRVYALVSAGRLPAVQKDGSALIARTADLDAWLRAGGGKRP